jgi:hypothetical protein
MTTMQATTSNSTSLSASSKIQDINRSRQGRIPAALQAIFLASNGGQEVNEPPRNLGFKVFSRLLGSKSKKQVYDKRGQSIQVSSPEDDAVSHTCPFSSLSVIQFKEFLKLTRSFYFVALNGTGTPTRILRYCSQVARILHRAVYNH